MSYDSKPDVPVEEEELYTEPSEVKISKPFNPLDVDIISQTLVLSNVFERLRFDEIELTPDFQRNPNLWGVVRQSRLIESLIIRIPLPTFYFDASDENRWIVVDGLQRLWTMKCFVVEPKGSKNKFQLKNLEYLKEYEDFYFEDLPRDIQRRIKEQTILAYLIRKGTPDKVRNSIFERINTGGMTLSPAEIKNSIYRGQAADFLKKMAADEQFLKATRNRISPERMLDREFINRFISFYVLSIESYRGNLEEFLCDGLETIKTTTASTLDTYQKAFTQAMELAYSLFGETAFRKPYSQDKETQGYGSINKPLFECVSVNLALLSSGQAQLLVARKASFWEAYKELFLDIEFFQSISSATGYEKNAIIRHAKFKNLLERVLT
ncbi:MAG: DUF262 domain-containing protein [Sphaerochaeta sp.]